MCKIYSYSTLYYTNNIFTLSVQYLTLACRNEDKLRVFNVTDDTVNRLTKLGNALTFNY